MKDSPKTVFDSEQFKSLKPKQKKEFVLEEFRKCRNSFQYFLDNYAFIRHKVGIIKMKAFDFQLDVTLPIAEILVKGRSKENIQRIKEYSLKFNYKDWLKEIEKNIELVRLIPEELHDFYLNIVPSPLWRENIDTIILKSRQTGLSTIFQVMNAWHVNFFDNVQDLVVSFREKEAKKYMTDLQRTWQNIPGVLRAKKLKKNEHELVVSLTGEKDSLSQVGSFSATPDAARSYSPNLIILDEFASYKNVEALWSAVVGSLSTGGIMVIISTPKGVGNLYHELWTKTKEYIKNPSVRVDGLNTNFKPYVIHWSQLPQEEFNRRGFDNPVDWYNWMRGYLIMEGGEKKAAQELDLEFLTSGNTALSSSTIKLLSKKKKLDTIKPPKVLNRPEELKGLKIYEEPKVNSGYILGVDVAEGRGKDYSTITVLKIPDTLEGIPEIVAEYRSNNIGEKAFAKVVSSVAMLYNQAFINIELNNSGKVVIEYLKDIYPNHKILNTYKVSKSEFVKGQKGWDERSGRKFLTSYVVEFVEQWVEEDNFYLTETLYNEFLTFMDKNGRYEHAEGKHDDQIFAYGLALVGIFLLQKYKQFLVESKEEYAPVEIDDYFFSSEIEEKISPIINRENLSGNNKQKYMPKNQLDTEELVNLVKNEIDIDNEEKKTENKKENKEWKPIEFSKVEELEDDYDDLIF